MALNVDSVRLKPRQRPVATDSISLPQAEVRGWLVPTAWAFAICPVVFLLSNVPMLNFFARGILAAFIAWFIFASVFRREELTFPVIIAGFLGWTVLALLVGAVALDLNLALRKWVTVFSLGLLAIGVANAVVWSGSARPWGWAYVSSALLAYLSNYLPINQFIAIDYETEILGRFVGTLANANEFGRAMVEGSLIALALLVFDPKGKRAFVLIIAMGMLGLAVFESSSRTALLGLGISSVLFFTVLKIRDLASGFNATGILGVIGGFVVVLVFFPKHFFTALDRTKIFLGYLGIIPEVETGERSIEGRVGLAERALQVWYENPLGVGLDNFRLFVGTYSHSNYLEILVSTGVLGLLAYYVPFVAFLILLKRAPRSDESRQWFTFVCGALIACGMMDLFAVSYYSKTYWVFIGIVCGMSVLRLRTSAYAKASN